MELAAMKSRDVTIYQH